MLNRTADLKVNKGFIKTGDLQRKILGLRLENADLRPVDAAHALLAWFQEPDNEFVRLDILHYAISHMWGTVTSKIDEDAVRGTPSPRRKARVAQLVQRASSVALDAQQRKTKVAEAADQAIEQIVSTLKLMTFKQARLMWGATDKLDLFRGTDDQLLSDVYSEAELREAVG